MMKPNILAQAARAFEALDFSSENSQIEALESEIATTETAIQAAEERCSEISRTLQGFRGPSGQQVADALLANLSPTQAAIAGPNAEDLEQERSALRAGIRDLQHRVEDARAEISVVQSAARSKVTEPARVLIDAYLEQARDAAEIIVETYAALECIRTAAQHGGNEAAGMKPAVEGIMRDRSILPWRRENPVPADVQHALTALQGKGKAFPSQIRGQVSI